MKFTGLFDTAAEETLAAIDNGIKKDNGRRWKESERKWFGIIEDAYRADSGDLRDHLGASQIGNDCVRKVWLGFRTKGKTDNARLTRLWNRGHLEEARFLALLEQAGIEVWNDRGNGKQFGYADGIFAGSIDGLAYGVPECKDEIVMLEFKTMNDRNFTNFQNKGISEFPQYEKQCQVNMYCMNKYAHTDEIFTSLIWDKVSTLKSQKIEHTLFLAVNKNTDDLHGVIIKRNDTLAEQILSRIDGICNNKTLPEKLSDRESYYLCRMCEHHDFCFGDRELDHNCRTCFLQDYDPETKTLKCVMDGTEFSENCYTAIDFEMR